MCAFVKQCAVSAMAIAVLLFAGCSQSTKSAVNNESETAKEAAAPPELVTAKTAFWPMYTSARNWATDLVTLRLTSAEIPGFKNEGGKAAMWQATFGSPSLQQYRVYSYAITSVEPDIHKGVSVGLGMPWKGETRDVMPIDLSIFNVDSDAAYQTASADAAAWLKKNPAKTISSFELGNAFRFHTPVWGLVWGDKKSGYIAFIDANTGKVLKGKS
jgi:hypothetical protein